MPSTMDTETLLRKFGKKKESTDSTRASLLVCCDLCRRMGHFMRFSTCLKPFSNQRKTKSIENSASLENQGNTSWKVNTSRKSPFHFFCFIHMPLITSRLKNTAPAPNPANSFPFLSPHDLQLESIRHVKGHRFIGLYFPMEISSNLYSTTP